MVPHLQQVFEDSSFPPFIGCRMLELKSCTFWHKESFSPKTCFLNHRSDTAFVSVYLHRAQCMSPLLLPWGAGHGTQGLEHARQALYHHHFTFPLMLHTWRLVNITANTVLRTTCASGLYHLLFEKSQKSLDILPMLYASLAHCVAKVGHSYSQCNHSNLTKISDEDRVGSISLFPQPQFFSTRVLIFTEYKGFCQD